jgi:amino acid adenylation domain-containing protein
MTAVLGGPVAFNLEAVLTGSAVELHYDPDLLDAEIVEEFARQFAALAGSAAADAGVTVADLDLAAPAERQQLLDSYRTPLAEIGDEPVHDLFEAHAARRPDAIAVVAGERRFTYRELDERANRLANHLQTLGVGPNVAVGLCMDRSAEMVEALLGILKAGGAYVPLNFEHPAARLAHQLVETAAPVLVTQEPLLDRLPEFDGAVVCIDRDAPVIATQPATPPQQRGSADDLVYVMYTSGSTGLPKGVEVTHRNLTGYVAAVTRVLELREDEQLGFAAVSAISTDLGNTSVFGGLLTGGTLHLVSPEVAMDGALFASYLESNVVDVLKVAPSQLASLIAGADVAAVMPRRWLVIGGEAARWELVDRLSDGAGTCRILNHYGPTETTVGACTFEISGSSARRSSTAPIGRPLGDSSAYVVDRQMRLLPPGIPGELCIGGHGVARGYVGQEDQTAIVFQPDPFSDGTGRLYRTGDRARLLGDGTIEFLGRIDGQLKIRGYRVEPGEIEAVLRRHPAVSDVAVVGRASEDGDPVLVGYVVAPAAPSDEELTALLRDALPAYMTPSRLVRLDALPLTASGKVDRSALPDPSDSPRATEYVASRNDLEESLVEIWEELLGVRPVGVLDDFFELGGHSLLATQVVIRIRKKHADIPLHSIFESPTVAGLAEVVERAGRETANA